MSQNVFPVLINRGFHRRYVNRKSKAIKEALVEINRRLNNPYFQSEKKILLEERSKLISLLGQADAREKKRKKRKKKKAKKDSIHQMIESVRRMDMNPSRKDICRPGRGWRGVRPGAPPVQGGFTDGHGKVDGWKKDE